MSEELRVFLIGVQRDARRILDLAFWKTKEYLPVGTAMPKPKVIVLPIGCDSRVEAQSIYLDPALACIVGRKGVIKILAHELHHISRFELTGQSISGMDADFGSRLKHPHGLVRLWVTFLEMEGIADCVFDFSELELPEHRRMIVTRKQVYRKYAAHLGRIQEALILGERTKTAPADERAELISLVLRHVHPLGARLAREILGGLGRASLVQCVGEPQLFLSRYQRVARSKGLFLFDEELMAGLTPNWPTNQSDGTGGP